MSSRLVPHVSRASAPPSGVGVNSARPRLVGDGQSRDSLVLGNAGAQVRVSGTQPPRLDGAGGGGQASGYVSVL